MLTITPGGAGYTPCTFPSEFPRDVPAPRHSWMGYDFSFVGAVYVCRLCGLHGFWPALGNPKFYRPA